MKIKFFTLGCKVNQYETQVLREFFLKKGFKEENQRCADFYIINTCTVTHTADIKSIKYIRKAKKENPSAKILVTGCLAEKDTHLLEKEKVDYIIPQSKKHQIPLIFDPSQKSLTFSLRDECNFSLLGREPQPKGLSGFTSKIDASKIGVWSFKISNFFQNRAFVKIQDGCNNFCSFCKVRLVRGSSISRPLEDIIYQINALIDKGFREIVLCGINLGSWKNDNKDLYYLLRKIIKIKNLGRIRLSSLEPYYISKDLISLVSSTDKLCSHFHIPFQSASDKILKFMNKNINSSYYFKLLDNIRKKIPDCGISCDVMVGFPYEEEEDFCATLKLLKRAFPVKTHIFPYSERKGTLSSKFPQVDFKVMERRKAEAFSLSKRLSYKFRKSQEGKILKVILEDGFFGSYRRGYTDNYIRVLVKKDSFPSGAESSKSLFPIKIYSVDSENTYGVLEQDRADFLLNLVPSDSTG